MFYSTIQILINTVNVNKNIITFLLDNHTLVNLTKPKELSK